MEAEALATRAPTMLLAKAVGDGKCWLSNITRGISEKCSLLQMCQQKNNSSSTMKNYSNKVSQKKKMTILQKLNLKSRKTAT